MIQYWLFQMILLSTVEPAHLPQAACIPTTVAVLCNLLLSTYDLCQTEQGTGGGMPGMVATSSRQSATVICC